LRPAAPAPARRVGWSPKQISGRLALEHGAPVISHESIYRYIYYRREQKDYLCRLLPKAHSRRRRRSKSEPRPFLGPFGSRNF